ncbi:MAG: flavodoxin family protein [Syntrophobacterales bacterium]|nr:MAG: flavodoxin family protein [Syntrophobacterales bacterium]
MRILAIHGSPSMKRGKTYLVLEKLLKGAKKAGAIIEVIFLKKERIRGCTGCLSCWVKTPGKCFQKDDMAKLIEKLKRTDLMILATPVYVDGMTGQCKNFMDRLIPLLDSHYEIRDGHFRHVVKEKFCSKIFLISVCAFHEMDNFDPLILHAKRAAENLNMEYVGEILRPAVYGLSMKKVGTDRLRRIMQAFERAGEELVKNGAVSENTRQEAASEIVPKEAYLRTMNRYFDAQIQRR